MPSSPPVCPLCACGHTERFHEDKKRAFLRCVSCALVFVEPRFHLSLEEEKKIYLLHENNPDDGGYRRFLSRLVKPMCERLTPGAAGLDFGCGPGPTLGLMFKELGYQINEYDPFFLERPEVLQYKYDFICATEVIEHVSDPNRVLGLLFGMLNRDGYLGLMTKLVISAERFATWHYKNDPTHICFFSEQTLRYVAEKFGADLDIIGSDVIIFKLR